MKIKRFSIIAYLLLILAVAIWYFITNYVFFLYSPPPIAFTGSSEGLGRTQIVATLDAPVMPNKNVIWCSSFQIAWNQLKDKIIKAPVKIAGDPAIVDRLNNAKESAADLPSGSYVAEAGFVDKGIIQKIKTEMSRKFPAAQSPDFPSVPSDSIIAYAYLEACLNFKTPYFKNKGSFKYKSSKGNKTKVSSFGIYKRDHFKGKLKDQVDVLFYDLENKEFAVDADSTSKDFQIILAKIPLKKSLKETLKYFDEKTNNSEHVAFNEGDVFLAPDIYFSIDHAFKHLQGKNRKLENKGYEDYWIEEAKQCILFKMDRSGVKIVSKSFIIVYKSYLSGHKLIFDGPFLIIMKKRNAENPFFVMWVDNSELLCKQQGKPCTK